MKIDMENETFSDIVRFEGYEPFYDLCRCALNFIVNGNNAFDIKVQMRVT